MLRSRAANGQQAVRFSRGGCNRKIPASDCLAVGNGPSAGSRRAGRLGPRVSVVPLSRPRAGRVRTRSSRRLRAARARPRSSRRPGSGMHGSLDDVLALGRELLEPTVVAGETLAEMRSVQFPASSACFRTSGVSTRSIWGLGVQLNTSKPSWMGTRTSARTFGHFGRSRTSCGSIRLPALPAPRSRTAVRRLGNGGSAAPLTPRSQAEATPGRLVFSKQEAYAPIALLLRRL